MNTQTIINKINSWEKIFKYEESYLWKKLVKKLDEVFNKFIRERDMSNNCVSYWAESCKNLIQNACHRIPCERYSHRRNENNVNWWCSSCNGFNKQEHQKYYTIRMINRYWQKNIDTMLREKNKIKPDIDYLIKMIEVYENKSKNLLLKKQKKSV